MKICFVLPRTPDRAIGGYKIIYEYANRLINLGYKVTILYLNTNYLKRYPIPKFVKSAYFNWLKRKEYKWFSLDSRIERISDYVSKQVDPLLTNTDVAIATAVRTSKYVSEHFKTTNKIYFIQGRETWSQTEKEVDDTYRLGMKNVVISKWLKGIVDEKAKKKSYLIPNPIDTEKYKIMNPIESRKKYSIGCLYNPNPCKGFDNAYSVMKKLKSIYPETEGIVFGAYERPGFLPEWINYVKHATQKETIDIYNNVSVFLCSSIDEGYGLTGLESMACGCALCSTDYSAVHEYAEDGINCLLSPVFDIEAQVENVCRLFKDNELRIQIANKASESVRRFSWDIAITKFIDVIKDEMIIS